MACDCAGEIGMECRSPVPNGHSHGTLTKPRNRGSGKYRFQTHAGYQNRWNWYNMTHDVFSILSNSADGWSMKVGLVLYYPKGFFPGGHANELHTLNYQLTLGRMLELPLTTTKQQKHPTQSSSNQNIQNHILFNTYPANSRISC